eukprot:CAMPEP_0197607962 /NCGR_PEP_ID=MMETSP1326-20131121/48126_1 /TAXON_ID=1155430 /ORGANISM="Genus nov. species nov., Strain RCC2288" /LENGTH=50 /DNA_ID=CAMNT_0043176097 /DNA_START=60 /DNA_END=208 /DNA_ORIENTATION=-
MTMRWSSDRRRMAVTLRPRTIQPYQAAKLFTRSRPILRRRHATTRASLAA